MKTSSAKAKGRRCAQEVKEVMLAYAFWLKDDDIVVTPSGVTGPDLHLSPKAKETFPLAIECKNQESISIWAALDQAETHADHDEGLMPALFFKRNNSELYCALKAEDLMRLIK